MQYAAAHAVRAAMKLTVCCYDSRYDVWENFWDLMVWQTSCWNGFDVVLKVVVVIFLWDIENVPTAVYICKILIGTLQQATALSILVIIVNFW